MKHATPTVGSSLTAAEVELLYVRHRGELLALCQRITRDPTSAEDALQSAMVKLLRHGAKLRTADSPRAWLFTAVAHCCYDVTHTQARLADMQKAQQAIADEPKDPIGALEARDAMVHARRALTEAERTLIWQHCVDALEQGELAELYQCARQTVHLRLSRIRSKLRALDEDHETRQ